MKTLILRKNEEKLSLEVIREEKRRLMETLFLKKRDIEREMGDLEKELERLDNDIDIVEREIVEGQNVIDEEPRSRQRAAQTNPLMDVDEEEEMEERSHDNAPTGAIVAHETPLTRCFYEDYNDGGDTGSPTIHGNDTHAQNSIRGPPLETTTNKTPFAVATKKLPPSQAAFLPTVTDPRHNHENMSHAPAAATLPLRSGTLDSFFGRSSSLAAQSVARASEPTAVDLTSTGSTPRNDPHAHLKGDSFPWSQQLAHHLANTFRIRSFRGHQKEIINATMSGEDVFVIMRTGGGKSLTYQLPALLEGRGQSRKVSFVVSPLLSLIQDQEEQMNSFAPGSAISFTSGMQGGTAEHARRWDLVRDPDQGVCIVFVTPEKVSKSNKLGNEMEKLFAQGRLGRFVIDECHCACQWGHDFRPDYAQLGKLKAHFPSVPCIAVTATASDRVRDDVCRILRLGTNYRFFRSTANRPNLHYSIRLKPDGKESVVSEMVAFIKEKHPNSAGIVYTLSKKDADNVADSLGQHGVIARAYHSDVSPTRKNEIHRSWMCNRTQVVVATIAFGLGINKPDVRFVLHHSISKNLEAYYQESGRAGRDGESADCVLFYSPKDAPRMLKLVHGSSSEGLIWPMVRYAQESGNDAVCRNILMHHLGEPDCVPLEEVLRENEGTTTERRDVGAHAKTVVALLELKVQEGADVTLSMLVKDWRAKPENAPPCVANNPPAKDGLGVEDCERIIVSLLLEGVLTTNPHWGAYDTVVYLVLGKHGPRLLQSPNPKVIIRMPIKTAAANSKPKAASAGKKKAATTKAAAPKKAATKRKKTTKAAKKPAARKKTSKATKAVAAKTAAVAAVSTASTEVIELSSDDDERNDDDNHDDEGEYEFE